eukprot:6213246-Pleurochrysis_carterae.AAC.3
MEVKCLPPFVSVGKGINVAPESITPVRGIVLGIVIGSEYNASKKGEESRRWTLVRLRQSYDSAKANVVAT